MANVRRRHGAAIVAAVLSLAAYTLGVEKPSSTPETCVTAECHAEYSQKEYVHGPVGLGDCESCHETVDPNAHTFTMARQGRDLCEYCHLDQATKAHVHEPLTTGDCTECHDPHSSANPAMITTDTVAQLCQECHETGMDVAYPHGPVAVGECTICHDSHSSDHASLLTEEPTDLCFSCHVVTKEELSKYEFVHEPATNDCIGCHNPHGANNMKMLKAEAPDLCFSCHEDIMNTAETARYKHSAVTDGDSCLHCHTPHASTIEFELKDTPIALCESCHDEPVTEPNGEVIASFTAEIDHKEFLHGPVAQQDCKGCHAVHGGDHFRLLVEDYPPLFYAPFSTENYALCFSCHPESLVLTQRTTDLTDFRNGDLNLHYVHVNKPERGRTCRSCHATHASDLPKHVRETVPYGAWDLPIQFKKTETGGSCQPGCHLAFGYDRQSPVLNEVQPIAPTKLDAN